METLSIEIWWRLQPPPPPGTAFVNYVDSVALSAKILSISTVIREQLHSVGRNRERSEENLAS